MKIKTSWILDYFVDDVILCSKLFFLSMLLCCYQVLLCFELPGVESYNYPQEHRNIGTCKNHDTAVMIVAFNRPDYLSHVINSLEKNPESEFLPFYFFLDGGPKAKQVENTAIINSSKIKNKIIIIRERNYGCAKNHIDAKRFMFDWCRFDKLIVMEDDLVVSPSFIHINLAMLTWARKNYSNIGVVQCWSYCYLPKKQKRPKLAHVEDSKDLWWSFVGYCMNKEVWDKMKSIMYEFESFVDQIPHTEEFSKQRSKPADSFLGDKILNWIESIAKNRKPPEVVPGKKIFPSMTETLVRDYVESGQFKASQDITTGFALWMAGYVKLKAVVNRSIHIGEEGITTNKPMFEQLYKPMNLDHFPNQDFKLHDFVVAE